MKKTQIIIGILIGVITLTGLVYQGFCYFAPASELAVVSRRLDIKILTDQRDYIQRRIWEIEDRYNYGVIPNEVRRHLHDLKIRLQEIDRQLNTLQKGG